jgi:hypothetical protein
MPRKATQPVAQPAAQPVAQPAAQPVAQLAAEPVQSTETQRRAGRTLLVKGTNISPSTFSGLSGLVNQAETKTTNSVFLTFDTSPSALAALRKLRTDHTNLRVKFSHYRIFFTISGLTDTSDYNAVKQELLKHVETKSGAQVLFCKLYRKDNHYLGCGDLTIDTLTGMNALLSKDSGNKEYSITANGVTVTGTFYRYNTNKSQSQTQNQSVQSA